MTDIRQPRRSLWLVAQDFIQLLASLFGRSEEIAARHTLERKDWRLMCQWLRAGEALMRLLLMIEAAALPKPNTRPPRKRARRVRVRVRVKRVMEFQAEEPEAWRVSFRVLVCASARLARRTRKRRASPDPWGAARFKSAWPLAERTEALLRVFNDPLPCAQRLARRLYAAPHRARVLRVAPDLPPLVGAVAFGTVRDAAEQTRRVFDG
ncbi:MAG: hypothetical protein K2P58_09230 [Hyphomonadaceae bacterium]|nr:hypothetical protein [Hyphomonadaceae bacterium]